MDNVVHIMEYISLLMNGFVWLFTAEDTTYSMREYTEMAGKTSARIIGANRGKRLRLYKVENFTAFSLCHDEVILSEFSPS